jgi:hypothetical protein
MEGEMSQSETSEGRNGDTLLGYFLGYLGRAALRREQCNGFYQRVVRQQLCKHSRTCNNRGSCVFNVCGDATQQ